MLRAGVTLVEALIAVAVGTVLMITIIGLMTGVGKMGRKEAEIIGLHIDGQKALARFMRDLQESMAVVVPEPGHTLPYAVFRDKVNAMVYYSLVPGRIAGTYDLRAAYADRATTRTDTVLTGVRRAAFTARSDGALRIHLVLATERGEDFALYTQVRLRNRSALDP